jgi:hypothetical protein
MLTSGAVEAIGAIDAARPQPPRAAAKSGKPAMMDVLRVRAVRTRFTIGSQVEVGCGGIRAT